MNKIFLILLTIILINCLACHRHYTNDECLAIVSKKANSDQLDKTDRLFFDLGASIMCSKHENNPDVVIENLEKGSTE